MASFRSLRVVAAVIGLILVYFVGIIVRCRHPMVLIRNESAGPMQNVTVKVEYRGRRHFVGTMNPGQVRRVFVRPVGESHVNVEFTDAAKNQHVETVIGYVEDGYCSTGSLTVLSTGLVTTTEDTTINPCWSSWLDFVRG